MITSGFYLLVIFTKLINFLNMYFSFNGRKICYCDYGEGIPVVLLHGYLESSEVWHFFTQELTSEFRVISIDLPGHGNSDSYGTTHSMEFIATVVKALLDSLGIKKVFLTGHSLGGYVTLAFVDLFRDSLSGYSLFHSHPFPDTPETAEKRRREIALVQDGKKGQFYPENIKNMYAGSNLEIFSDALQRSLDIASRLNDEGIIAILNGMMTRPSRLSVMEQGRVPCLWILGALDNYIPCEIMQTRVRLPANATLEVLKNSGHMGFVEEKALSAKILSNFIESVNLLSPS